MGYEMVAGHTPFDASSFEGWREHHLHSEPEHLNDVPSAFNTLIDECLYKAPEARPTPANLRLRLDRAAKPRSSTGLSALEEANRIEVLRRQEAARQESEARSESERRGALAAAGQKSYEQISEALRNSIEDAAPSATVSLGAQGGWSIRLGTAEIKIEKTKRHNQEDWGDWPPPVFDVVLVASVNVRIPADRHQYEGRSHSLWYCDSKEAAQFGWYETAFIYSPLVNQQGRQDPFALNPGEAAAKALSNVLAEYQVAWPFTEIPLDDIDEFLDRWADWFAKAAQGVLGHPSRMPERSPKGSWRLS
jgi:serine/threonine-protein kinase